MNSEMVRQFYNEHFFDGDRPKESMCRISIYCEGNELVIPAIKLSPGNTVDSIFRSYYDFLQAGGVPAELTPTPAQESTKEKEEEKVDEKLPVNIEQVKYRNHLYIVEQYAEDEFVIRNKDKEMKVISPVSVTARGILKKFREL